MSVARAAISSGQGIMRDFAERGCTEYTSLMRLQGLGYRDRLKGLLSSVQLRGDCSGDYGIYEGCDGPWTHFGNANSDVKCGGSTS